MLRLYARVKNIFRHSRHKADEEDYREFVLQKLFPAIRYGRDNDLERYIMLRENGQTSKEWGGFYVNLELRYTEAERRNLIRSYRKNMHAFAALFKSVLVALYKRVSALLLARIDELEACLRRIERDQGQAAAHAGERTVIGHLEKIIALCSPEMDTAEEGVDFLRDFAEHHRYKHRQMKRVAALVKGYLDGTLFEEAQVKEAYHFDIREERKKHYRRPATSEPVFKLKILITREDVSRIVIPEHGLNEYGLSFAYYERYLGLVDDHEFATKVYVYSKKHNSVHHQIYDVIRKGVNYGHQKGRIFDDVFKIISGGRYVFDIRSEQVIQDKLKSLGVKPAARPAARLSLPPADRLVRKPVVPEPPRPFSAPIAAEKEKPVAEKTVTERPAAKAPPEKAPAVGEEAETRKPAPSLIRKKIASEEAAEEPVRKVKKEKAPKAKPERGPTAAEMFRELTGERRAVRMLLRQFRARLPEIVTDAVRSQARTLFDEIVTAEKLKELIYYVGHNYDRIIAFGDERAVHKERIEALGSTLPAVYAAIMQCVNDVKAQYLSGELKVRRLFGGPLP